MDPNASWQDCISYKSLFDDSLTALKKELEELNTKKAIGNKIRIVSLGRKGVKLYESILHNSQILEDKRNNDERKENLCLPDIVSEHALPFVTRNDRDTKTIYYIMDDALYYGSSAKGVAKEVCAFENIYNISGRSNGQVGFYAAIDTGELRPNFDSYIHPVKALPVKDRGIGQGYSHYFAKHIASEIRSLESTFEIEFPIMTYTFGTNEDLSNHYFHGKKDLLKSIKASTKKEVRETVKGIINNSKKIVEDTYRDTDARVYLVDHEENYSINILLDKVSHCKIRIFPGTSEYDIIENNNQIYRVKVACVSPYPIRNDDYLLEHLFDNANEGYKDLWKKIFDRCRVTASDVNPNNIMDYQNIARLRCNKSLVILANYLLSFSTFIQQCNRIEDSFSKAGINATYRGVDTEKDLYYLLGDKEFCCEVAEQLNFLYMNRTECGEVNVNDDMNIDYTVFENSKNVDESTATYIHFQNDYMLGKSQNIEEALGVLFYNQDVFYEKQVLASNPITQDFNRLRIGYTFHALVEAIKEALSKGYFKRRELEDLEETLHRWIDQRIDEASIVPQYILDEKSKCWLRVFRHGENEEPLLGHLARFVLLVYMEWDKQTKLGWVNKNIFQKLLAKAYEIENFDDDDSINMSIEERKRKRKEQITECTNIDIDINDDEGLIFTNSHYPKTDSTGKPHNVLQYMIDMCILSEELKDKIAIHKRTKFFIQPGITTIEKVNEEKIKKSVCSFSQDYIQ